MASATPEPLSPLALPRGNVRIVMGGLLTLVLLAALTRGSWPPPGAGGRRDTVRGRVAPVRGQPEHGPAGWSRGVQGLGAGGLPATNGVRQANLLARIMAMNTLPLATVRNQLSSLVDDVTRTHASLTITRNGKPAAVVISADDYESIMETLALLNDPIDQERLDEAERAVAAGDVTKGEDIDRLVAERAQRATGAA